MTNIMLTQDNGLYRLKIEGHNEKEICNGISTIAFALLNLLDKLDRTDNLSEFHTEMSDGRMDIEFRPSELYAEHVYCYMDFVETAFEMFVERYPRKVSYMVNLQ